MSSVLNLEEKLQTIADRIVPSDICAWTFGALFREKDGSVHQAWASAGELPAGRPENTTVTLTPDTTLHVYSCVKIFVSIAIMQLVERGVIGLDDSIMDILPDMIALGLGGEDGSTRPLTGIVTLRHLVTHTAGLASGFGSKLALAWYEKQSDEFREKNPQLGPQTFMPFTHEPGEVWQYAQGYEWLGRLIAKKTGLALDEYVQMNIAQPLGLDLFFSEQAGDPLPQTGVLMPGSVQWLGVLGPVQPGVEPNGGAGGVCSARALLEVLGTLANDGVSLKTGKRILSTESVKEMLWVDQLDGLGIAFPEFSMPSTMPLLALDPKDYPKDRQDAGIKKTWTIMGEMNLESLRNGRAAGTITWGGVGGVYWTLNPTTGTVCVGATQLLPFLHPRTLSPFVEAEREVLSHISSTNIVS